MGAWMKAARGAWDACALVVLGAVLLMCCVALLLVLPMRAYAGPSLAFSSVESIMPTSGTITLQFSNNVVGYKNMDTGEWGSWVFDGNVGHIALIDENGIGVGISAGHNFGGDQTQDPGNYRQMIFVNYGPLEPGSGYTLLISPGMSSAGSPGDFSGAGAELSFTTSGEKSEPEPEPEPEPISPAPVVPEGDGGSSGQGGSSAAGGGADQGGSSGTGESFGTSPESSVSAAASLDTSVVAVEAAPKSGESKAAGLGGGTVYRVGQTGTSVGEAVEEPAEATVSWSLAPALGLVALVLVLMGATKRRLFWRLHKGTRVWGGLDRGMGMECCER